MGRGLGEVVQAILRDDGRPGLFNAVLAELGTATALRLLVFEDAHWADGVTLDLLRFLGRRIASLPTLVLVSYRDDETGPAHPLRALLGDLATQRGVSRIELLPLSLGAITELAADRDADAASVLALTGGNPFFVTELLQHPNAAQVPATVGDAVLARLRRISPAARHAATVAATIGARVEPSVLYDLPGVGAADLDECVGAGLMRLTPPVFTFRHELVRQAVLSVCSVGERREISAAVLAVLRSKSFDDDALSRLAELSEAAGDADAVWAYAPAAARRAAGLGAHREAAAQYERALRWVVEADQRADLLEPLALEQYLVGVLPDAIASRREAVRLRRVLDEPLRVGDGLRWLARLHWYAGEGSIADGYATEALELLTPLGPSPELAMALSLQSQLLMLSGGYAGAISWGEQALELARELNLPDVVAHALNNIGTALSASGDESGIALVHESLAMSLAINSEDHAGRAYVNLASELVGLRRLDDARAVLDDAIQYCYDRDLDLQTPYLRSMRAQLKVHLGLWDEAVIEAREVLAGPGLTPLHTFAAGIPLALVPLRRGERVDLADLRQRAYELDEIQRLVPYACVQAEMVWLGGGSLDADSDAAKVYSRAMEMDNGHDVVELSAWLRRCGLDVTAPRDSYGALADIVSDPLTCAGRLAALGNHYDAALCLLEGDAADAAKAADVFARLGAAPALARAQARLRGLGATRIPRGLRTWTVADHDGLTHRQSQILALIAEGLSNAEIAARLFLSQRTVDHHVSAVLAKLGVPNRAAAALRYGHRGTVE
jgi:DNA-binding CsgD family transcriptional regulator